MGKRGRPNTASSVSRRATILTQESAIDLPKSRISVRLLRMERTPKLLIIRKKVVARANCEDQQMGLDDGLPKAREKLFLVPRVGEARRRSPMREHEIGGLARYAWSALATKRHR
jgi:hypothetical protein